MQNKTLALGATLGRFRQRGFQFWCHKCFDPWQGLIILIKILPNGKLATVRRSFYTNKIQQPWPPLETAIASFKLHSRRHAQL